MLLNNIEFQTYLKFPIQKISKLHEPVCITLLFIKKFKNKKFLHKKYQMDLEHLSIQDDRL